MADNVEITSGTPALDYLVHTKDRGSGIHDQVVAETRALTPTTDPWVIDTTGIQSRVAADPARVLVLMVNMGVGRVYMRFDNTMPLTDGSNCHWFLEPGERWELPLILSTLAISVRGVSAGGTLNIVKAVA